MPKLIDKHAAYMALKHEAETHGLSFSAEAYDRAARIIDQMPAIEAEPVRHGRWQEIGGYEPENQGFACSVCDFATTVKSRFCPHCGARMDGGADNG